MKSSSVCGLSARSASSGRGRDAACPGSGRVGHRHPLWRRHGARPEGAARSFLGCQKAQRGADQLGRLRFRRGACHLRHRAGRIGRGVAEVLQRRERLGLRRAGRGLRRRGWRRRVSSITRSRAPRSPPIAMADGALSFNSLTTRCASFGPTPCAARTDPQSPSATARATPSAPSVPRIAIDALAPTPCTETSKAVPFPSHRG
jgi:hypothetical protein